MELSVSALIIIGLVMLQLLIIAYFCYCCLTLPFRKKRQHESSHPLDT